MAVCILVVQAHMYDSACVWWVCACINVHIETQDNLEKAKAPTETSKEKHALTRKVVGYKNWRQRWCKKEGNKVLGKEK